MNGVFVSYRRADSSGHAGRIHDRLVEYYGEGRVFRDVEDIAAGDDFVQTIRDSISKRDVLLVIIGPDWLNITDDTGKRRLDDPRDVVRLEVAEALGRRATRVIPVLVNGAEMPSADDLPKPLAPLATRNAFEVLDTRFADDVTRLIKVIGGQPAGRVRKLAITGGLGLLAAGAAASIMIPILRGSPSVVADVNIYRGGAIIDGDENDAFVPAEIADTSATSRSDSAVPSFRELYTVTYENVRTNSDRVSIQANLPYRDLLLNGGPMTGGRVWWDWPRLSIQIVNHADETVYVSGVTIDIEESVTDTEPLVFVRQRISGDNIVEILNHGWGAALNPAMEVSVHPDNRCQDDAWQETDRTPLDMDNAEVITWSNETIQETPVPFGPATRTRLDITPLVPRRLLASPDPACVFGVLSYGTESGDSRAVKFKTRIRGHGAETASMIRPSAEYFLYLQADSSGYTKTLSVDHQVQPGSVEHFLVRVGTNKSAMFDLRVSIQVVGRDPFLADNLKLSIISPVGDETFKRDPNKRR